MTGVQTCALPILLGQLALFFSLILMLVPQNPVLAGPVEWQEVPASEAGQQWWDIGSLRRDRNGQMSVLTRFSPTAEDGEAPASGSLYVMKIDCEQNLFKDTQVNGLPRFRAQWQPSGADPLIDAVIDEVCNAGVA